MVGLKFPVVCTVALLLLAGGCSVVAGEGLVASGLVTVLQPPREAAAEPEVAAASPPWFCHGIDCPEYTLDESFTAVKGVERRMYAASKWVSIRVYGVSYDKARSVGFQALFKYISGENTDGAKIPMTAPVMVRPVMDHGGGYSISFFVPFAFWDATPEPTGKDVVLQPQPAFSVYVKSYGGFNNGKVAAYEAGKLSNALSDAGVSFYGTYFLTAAYDSPFRLQKRHNEVWFAVKKGDKAATPTDDGDSDLNSQLLLLR